jgi:hypothetical protein
LKAERATVGFPPLFFFVHPNEWAMFRTAANGANWNPSVIRYALRHCVKKNHLHRRATTIHLRNHHANMSHFRRCCAMGFHRRCCAILSRNPSMIRASHYAAEADYI